MREVFLPRSLEELWETLSDHPGSAVYAGGTDLFPRLRKGAVSPPACLVCLERISELKGVYDHGEKVFIGGCTTHTALLFDPAIRAHFPILAKGLAVLGSPHIRNMGTLAGNIVTASPAGDALPPLYVLKAQIETRSRSGRRRVSIQKFILGPGKVDLSPGEIVSGVWIDKGRPYRVNHFEKVGQRNALAISIVSLAALIDCTEGGVIERVRLAWGSVGPTVVAAGNVESFMQGKALDAKTTGEAAALAREAVSPIDDVRATASYRREVAGNLLLRLTNP